MDAKVTMSEIDYSKKELEVLWSVAQVAKYLGVHPVTIYRWLSEGRVLNKEKVLRIGSRVRIPRSEVVRIAGVIKSGLEA